MIERKYYAHFLDAAFDMTYSKTNYARLGKDLEEYNEELNPQVEISSNILGEQSVKHSGYQAQAEVSPFYYENYEDALSNKMFEILNTRATGDKCKTSVVDVLLKPDETDPENNPPTVVEAWREDVYAIPNSGGGDTSGIQIPFTIYKAGNRVKGEWDIDTRKFTPGTSDPGSLSD